MNDDLRPACYNHPDPDAWFPEPARYADEIKLTVLRGVIALKVCAECPFTKACLKLGMEDQNIDWGIFGGALSHERKRAVGWGRSYSIRIEEQIRKRATLAGVPVPVIEVQKRELRKRFGGGSRSVPYVPSVS